MVVPGSRVLPALPKPGLHLKSLRRAFKWSDCDLGGPLPVFSSYELWGGMGGKKEGRAKHQRHDQSGGGGEGGILPTLDGHLLSWGIRECVGT